MVAMAPLGGKQFSTLEQWEKEQKTWKEQSKSAIPNSGVISN